MNIGSIIKELRQKKKMSQEELAEYLGVSAQAVSRWETSVSYPDITLLPLIANVFNVTVDYLLGTDKFKNDKLIEEVKKEYHKYQCKGDNVGAHKYMKQIYEKYPNVENLQLMYADSCSAAHNEDKSIIDEGIEVLERLVRLSCNEELKSKAYDDDHQIYQRGRTHQLYLPCRGDIVGRCCRNLFPRLLLPTRKLMDAMGRMALYVRHVGFIHRIHRLSCLFPLQ